MWTYFFPDAEDNGAAKPIRFHSDERLEDRELQDRMLAYNATSVHETPNSGGATRIGGYKR